jgi:hypothetical protein
MLRPSHDVDPSKVSSPRIFLVRMLVFVIIGILPVVILNEQIRRLLEILAHAPAHRD